MNHVKKAIAAVVQEVEKASANRKLTAAEAAEINQELAELAATVKQRTEQ